MLLREYVMIHLPQPADKLQALLSMTAKLFALAAGLCAEDNADALSSHEALLPGSLLSKFMADKLAECLAIFKRQVMPGHCSGGLLAAAIGGSHQSCEEA